MLHQARGDHRAMVKKWQTDYIELTREMGPKCHLGAFRKGFATEAIKAAVHPITVAHPLGHRDSSMVSRVCGMVQQDPARTVDEAKKAKSGKGRVGESRACSI